LDTKIESIIDCNTCGVYTFVYNLFYRLKVLDPGLGSQLFELMDNIKVCNGIYNAMTLRDRESVRTNHMLSCCVNVAQIQQY
jgi:hypothetical protein